MDQLATEPSQMAHFDHDIWKGLNYSFRKLVFTLSRPLHRDQKGRLARKKKPTGRPVADEEVAVAGSSSDMRGTDGGTDSQPY